MGLWDAIKSVAKSVKCGVGVHAGEYAHVKGKPKCFLGKTCPDCKKYITTQKHEFGDWDYQKDQDCTQARTCAHCKKAETRVEHQFGGWSYADQSCTQVSVCARCKETKTEVWHSFNEKGKDEQCRIIKVCSRCQLKELGSTKHNFIKNPLTGNDMPAVNGYKKCKDCNSSIKV
ncbi:hypothetical protein [Helicobacter felis]|uniref:hypothetical protein n=1 Tax=Helicobacter felis TaxID=214 RepID=UPI000CF0C6C9|nr:hypothetical protein [Helicobacter felis]